MSRAESLKKYWKKIKADPQAYAKRGRRKSTRSLDERFWEKVDKNSDPNGCWLWTAATLTPPNLPYGVIQEKGKALHAHRVAYALTYYTTLTPDVCICHSCDNPRCVNPNHLFPGTRTTNIQDRDAKNRQTKGEAVLNAKLTEKDIQAIRAMYATGRWSQIKIAKLFCVKQPAISAVILRQTWKHVP